ncbi:MAG: MarP family serine protease [Actinomycetota bacterium]
MSLLDIVLIALLLLAGYTGSRRGAAQQLVTYVGVGAGFVVGTLLAPPLAARAGSPAGQAELVVGTLLVCGAIGDAIGWFFGSKLRARVVRTRLSRADTLGGSFVSVGAVLLVVWFLALNLVSGPVRAVSQQIQRSAIVRGLAAALPEPPSLIGEARRFLNVLGFPDVFLGLPPLPAAPVSPPTAEQASTAFDAASASTVQIVEAACDELLEGSGFVAGPGLVVTNAHVVAGGDSPQVRLDGASFGATTVLFAPALDIAILRVPDLHAPPLALSSSEWGRGAAGSVLGYPEAGPLTGRRAAIRAVFDATGRDIYGEDRVIRRIYELQTLVRPGNSGGPFVLTNGQVAGVVFAASSMNQNTGYAITSLEVLPLVSQAGQLTTAADTGPCDR